MLYEIREQTGELPFKLFLKKKKGFKFKKAFRSKEEIELFLESYLRCCCLDCRERGWVYKTRRADGLGGGVRRISTHRLDAGSTLICPECLANHSVQYEDAPFHYRGKLYTRRRIVLSRSL